MHTIMYAKHVSSIAGLSGEKQSLNPRHKPKLKLKLRLAIDVEGARFSDCCSPARPAIPILLRWYSLDMILIVGICLGLATYSV